MTAAPPVRPQRCRFERRRRVRRHPARPAASARPPARHRDQTAWTVHRARWLTAGRRRVVEDRRPATGARDRCRRANTRSSLPPKNARLLKPRYPIRRSRQHRRRQRVQLTAGILEIFIFQRNAELALLHGVLREPRVGAQPAAALRIEARSSSTRRRLVPAHALRHHAQGEQP